MTAPFFVLGLPRSRTAWLSRYLSYWPRRCGHDLAITSGTVAGFVGNIGTRFDGTCETAGMLGWDAIKFHFPTANVAVVRRPLGQVMDSLARFGVHPDKADMERRAALLDRVSDEPGVMTVDYDLLGQKEVRKALFEHCLELPLDDNWDSIFANWNIQVDMPTRLADLAKYAPQTERLKTEAAAYAAMPKDVVLAEEPWSAIWPECDKLGAQHFDEVDSGVEPRRPFKLDDGAMDAMNKAGILKIYTARRAGKMLGYCTWNVTTDVESKGLLIAIQGAWFCLPKAAAGVSLFMFALRKLTELGVKVAFPHHRLQGRGDRLGTFFKRLGAKEIKHEFSLWIGDGPCLA